MAKKLKEDQDAEFNLKHDTMEFAAPADGLDPLDEDQEGYEPDEIILGYLCRAIQRNGEDRSLFSFHSDLHRNIVQKTVDTKAP